MEIVVIPQALLLAYGAIVLGGGAVLGFIAGRQNRSRTDPRLGPSGPEGLDRRLRGVEDELDLTRSELDALREERDFYRRLVDEPGRWSHRPDRCAA